MSNSWTGAKYRALIESLNYDCLIEVAKNWYHNELYDLCQYIPTLAERLGIDFEQLSELNCRIQDCNQLNQVFELMFLAGPKLRRFRILNHHGQVLELYYLVLVKKDIVEELARQCPNIEEFDVEMVHHRYSMKFIADYAKQFNGHCNLRSIVYNYKPTRSSMSSASTLFSYLADILKNCDALETITISSDYEDFDGESRLSKTVVRELREYLKKPLRKELARVKLAKDRELLMTSSVDIANMLGENPNLIIKFDNLNRINLIRNTLARLEHVKPKNTRVYLLFNATEEFNQINQVASPVVVYKITLDGVNPNRISLLNLFSANLKKLKLINTSDTIFGFLLSSDNLPHLEQLKLQNVQCGQLFIKFLEKRQNLLKKDQSVRTIEHVQVIEAINFLVKSNISLTIMLEQSPDIEPSIVDLATLEQLNKKSFVTTIVFETKELFKQYEKTFNSFQRSGGNLHYQLKY